MRFYRLKKLFIFFITVLTFVLTLGGLWSFKKDDKEKKISRSKKLWIRGGSRGFCK